MRCGQGMTWMLGGEAMAERDEHTTSANDLIECRDMCSWIPEGADQK